MRVRPLRDVADVRELTVAHGRAWRTAYEGLLPRAVVDRVATEAPSDERVASEYERLTGYGGGRVLVAEDDDGTVRGYAVCRWGETEGAIADDEAELKELYVDPAYWNEGVGTALLAAAIDRLPGDIDSLALEVLEGNDVATSFYESRGFDAAGAATLEVGGQSFPTRVYRRSLG